MIDMVRLIGLAGMAAVVAGCGTSQPVTPTTPSPEGRKSITFHIPEMGDRLELLWADWPNRVKQALAGLEGVVSVEDEWDRDPEAIDLEDLLFVEYESDTIEQEQLLETIRQEGFEAEIRAEWSHGGRIPPSALCQTRLRIRPLEPTALAAGPVGRTRR